ncbi:hypothetical protein KEJ44_08495, partial [Candidatus Bathyarchaeota archaeon]|nr:hypothetical protein [Candidatus Bathyarchaeota archaeon]
MRNLTFTTSLHAESPTGTSEARSISPRKRMRLGQIMALASIILILIAALPRGIEAAAITEYELPPGSTKPYGITIDDKATSSVWAAVYGSDKIDRLKLDSTLIYEYQLPTGSRPWAVAYDNRTDLYRIWFTESQRHKIGLINDVEGSPTLYEFNLTSGAGPRGLAIQPKYHADGRPRIWFAEFGLGAVGALTPDGTSGWFVNEFYLPDSNCGPLDIIYLGSSGVWFTEYQGHRIGNYNPATNTLREWALPAGSYPWGIANDTYGNIWFTESGRNRIGKLNPYTNEITEYYIPTPNAQPYGIVVDKYNNVWFAEHGSNKIGRFSPGTNTLVEFERKSGGAPWDMVYAYAGGEEGKIWFTEEVGNKLCRIDDTEAKTTITVTSRYVVATQSSTATTLGSSVTKTISTEGFITPGLIGDSTAYSYTSYRVTETSSFLRTSYIAEFTSTAFYTATTTVTATSYVTTVYTTTSVTATTTSVETSLTSVTATSTMTSYIATLTATGTVTSTSTVTVTSYEYATTGFGPPIPGYSSPSILMGLALGSIALIALRFGRRLPHTLRKGGWLAFLLSSLLVLVAVLPPAAQAALVTEWSLPPGSTIPYGIAFDDQSPYRVWFAEFGSDKIGRLDHVSGEIFEIKLPATSQPWGVAFESARHELWFTMPGRNKLGCISGYGTSIYELTLESQPRGLAVQEHVNGTNYPYIWVALYGNDKIARVDPYYAGKVVYWTLTSGAKPQSIIFVPDTGVWFTEDGPTPGKIGNLNPATGEVKEWNLPGSTKAWALASDTYGFIWFTDYADNHIGRLNPYTGEIILYRVPTSNSQPYGIAVDSIGGVWFAEHAQNRIGRFSPDSLTFEEFAKPTGGSTWGLAISQDGKIWFTDDAGNKICRLDPEQALATTTVSEISTASKTTSTVAPGSATVNSEAYTTTRSDVATTRTTAPTTVTTTYGLTETVKVLRTSTTTSNTSFIPTTITVLGDLTLTVTNTISTHTVTETTPYTSTTYTYTTKTDTYTTTRYNTVTV